MTHNAEPEAVDLLLEVGHMRKQYNTRQWAYPVVLSMAHVDMGHARECDNAVRQWIVRDDHGVCGYHAMCLIGLSQSLSTRH